jgi:hypothetical protein
LVILKTSNEAPWHPWQKYGPFIEPLFDDVRTVETQEWDGEPGGTAMVCAADEWDRPLPELSARRLVSWVDGGGGLLVLHHGISLQSRPELAELIGGRFTGHPPAGELTFRAAETGFTWTMTDEPYQFDGLGPIRPLLEYEYQGTWHLGGWERPYGKGLVIYLMPGHFPENFGDERYRALIRSCWNRLRTRAVVGS